MSERYWNNFDLIFEEKVYTIENNPMRKYLEPLMGLNFFAADAVCWHLYRGRMAFEADKLYLKKFEAITLDKSVKKLKHIFPGKRKVFMKWFTGVLWISIREQAKQKYGNRGEIITEQFMHIENGRLVKIEKAEEIDQELLEQKRTDCMVQHLIERVLYRTEI